MGMMVKVTVMMEMEVKGTKATLGEKCIMFGSTAEGCQRRWSGVAVRGSQPAKQRIWSVRPNGEDSVRQTFSWSALASTVWSLPSSSLSKCLENHEM